MTRRRIIFICKDGRRYITEEFNGDKNEYAARGQCQDGCDMAWSEIRDIFQETATYTQFIKAKLKAQAAYHSFLGEDGNSGVVRNLRKGREAPDADRILFVYANPLATGTRLFETQRTCFTPVPGSPYPACSGQYRERCQGCPLRHDPGQTLERKRLQVEHGWPMAIHTEGEDAYLIGAQTMQDGLEPIYLFPDGQHDQPSRMLHPAEEFYRLRGILRDDPRALDDQCELFCACPPDWYKELALYAMRRIALVHGLPMTEGVQSEHEWAAHHVTKAVFEEQDLFDPYSDTAFLNSAAAILPWYVRRYTKQGDV